MISRVNLTSKLEAYINLTYPVLKILLHHSELSKVKQPVPSPPSWPAVSNRLSFSFLLKCCNDSKISLVFKGLVSTRSLICSNKPFVGELPKFFPSVFVFVFVLPHFSIGRLEANHLWWGYSISN